MAFPQSLAPSSPFLLLVSAAAIAVAALSAGDFGLTTAAEKAHLHFYMHDIVSGHNATAVRVASSPTNGTFGIVVVIDDPMTDGPNLTSRLIGRAQGMYSFASLQGASLLWTVNFVFGDGKYNGSSLALLGMDDVSVPARELPVVGGTGLFRLARGFAVMKTYSLDPVTGYTVLEIDAYVKRH